MLVGKILSPKAFSCWLVKDILTKAWNLINEVEVNVVIVDKTTFMFVFKHEADVRSAWEQRPWSILKYEY